MRRTATFCVAMLVAAATARGDGLLYQVPADGTWARYDVTITNRVGDKRKVEVTFKVVGTVEQNGEKLRWIEVKHPVEGQTHIVKMLIPEKHLKAGEEPLRHVQRAWRKRGGRQPESLGQARGFWLEVLLAGPLSNVEKLEKAPVQSKLGERECEGLSGQARIVENGGYQLDLKYRVRRHPEAPFGVVACHVENKVSRNGRDQGTSSFDIILSDLGTDAESELQGYE
jgi:hypothetical protein